MRLLRQFSLVLGVWITGEFIVKFFRIPVPGNIFGMLLLFLLLYFKVIKLQMLEEISKFLLDHLAFFFIPSGVALIASLDILKEKWMSLLLIIILTTFIVIAVTGMTVQLILKKGEKHERITNDPTV